MYTEVNVLWVDQQVHCRQLSSSIQSGSVLWDTFPNSLDNQSVGEEFIYLTVHYTGVSSSQSQFLSKTVEALLR